MYLTGFADEAADGIDGQGDVRRVLKDLLDRGYDGGISIEPHVKAVAHDASVDAAAEVKFAAYVEYGRRLMKLLAEIGHPTHGRN
jgi:predicted xylose isomerase-like sugar epimerase